MVTADEILNRTYDCRLLIVMQYFQSVHHADNLITKQSNRING